MSHLESGLPILSLGSSFPPALSHHVPQPWKGNKDVPLQLSIQQSLILSIVASDGSLQLLPTVKKPGDDGSFIYEGKHSGLEWSCCKSRVAFRILKSGTASSPLPREV